MCKLLHKSEEFTLPSKFEKIGELSDPVYESLTKDEKKYEIKSNVSKEAILLIIDYLTSGNQPEVHIDNIFDLNQLAQELELKKITILIKEKLTKWRQFENNLENQTFEKELKQKEENIHDLQIHIGKLYHEINLLKEQLRNQEIEFKSSLNELEVKLAHKNEEVISQVIQESSQNYEFKYNEISNKLEVIQDELQSKESLMQEQSIRIQENNNSVDRLKSQIENLNDQFSTQKNSNSQSENEFNTKLCDIGLKIEELKDKYITKDI